MLYDKWDNMKVKCIKRSFAAENNMLIAWIDILRKLKDI